MYVYVFMHVCKPLLQNLKLVYIVKKIEMRYESNILQQYERNI